MEVGGLVVCFRHSWSPLEIIIEELTTGFTTRHIHSRMSTDVNKRYSNELISYTWALENGLIDKSVQRDAEEALEKYAIYKT